MDRILITGGAGFIGSHLAEALLREENEVICLDNFNDYYSPEIKRKNIESALQNPSYKLVEGDILDLPLLERLFRDIHIDVVVHLAARAGVRPSLKDPLLYQEVNVKGTNNLLEVARQTGVKKLVVASSSSVYGTNEKVPFSEDDFVDHPISPYAATKKACELICYTYHHLYNLPITCLRFFTVYGPRQRPDMAIHKFTRSIHFGQKITMFGDGKSRRDYTYIDDIIDGICKSIEHCKGYHIYNLGESHTIELRELIDVIASALGKQPNIEVLPLQPGDVPITYADITRAKREIGYDPKVLVRQGVAAFAEWFKEVGCNY